MEGPGDPNGDASGLGRRASGRFGAVLDIRALGPLAVRVEGEPVDLRRPKLKELLVALVLAGGVPQSTDRLADQLWDEGNAPASAGNLIEKYVSDLRALLGWSTVTTHPAGVGYSLPRDDVDYDVDRFRSLISSAESALGESRAEEADELVAQALALVRGPAFIDVERREFAQPAIRSVQQMLETASGLRVEVLLAAGKTAHAIGECHEALERDPQDEARIAQLVRALCMEGRRTEALRRIQAARAMYAEIGLDIGPPLADLEDRILREDSSLFRVSAPPSKLPPPQPLYERHDELAMIRRDLDVERGVWLIGEPGVGTSSIASGVAHLLADGFDDGTWWVDCSSSDEPDMAFDDALGLLGVLGSAEPGTTLERYLSHRTALVVFDGCSELVSEAVAGLTEALGDSRSRVIVTSQHPPPAVFARRITCWPTDPDGDDRRAARAFLLAAGMNPDTATQHEWSRAWAAAQSCAGLPADVVALGQGARHVGMSDADSGAGEVEQRMEVFAGPVSSEVLAEVVSFGVLDGHDIDFHVQRLVAQGRVVVRQAPHGLRYRRSKRGQGTGSMADSYLVRRYVTCLADRCTAASSPAARAEDGLDHLGVGGSDLRRAVALALDAGDRERAAAIAYAYGRRRALLGTHLVRLLRWMESVDDELRSSSGARAGLVATIGFSRFRIAEYKRAASEFARAIDMAREVDDPHAEAAALIERGHMHMFTGRHAQAADDLSEGHERALASDSRRLVARAMLLIAQQGMYQSATPTMEQAALIRAAAAENRTRGFVVAEANCRLLLATWHLLDGQAEAARSEGRTALDLLGGQSDRSMLAFALSRNAHISAALEHPEEAIRMAREAVGIADANGNQLVLAAALLSLADAISLQNVRTAAVALGAAQAVYSSASVERTGVDAQFEAAIRDRLSRSGRATDEDYRRGVVEGVAALDVT